MSDVEMRTCTKCGETKPLTPEYWNRRGDKFRANCKNCQHEAIHQSYKAKNPNAKRRRSLLPTQEGYRICSKCEQEKPFTSEYFYKAPRGKNGLSAVCRECNRTSAANWRASNPEHVKLANQRYREAHRPNRIPRTPKPPRKPRVKVVVPPDVLRAQRAKRAKEWRDKNIERAREYSRRWYYANREKAREHAQRWRQANVEKARAACRRSYAARPVAQLERVRKWKEANPEKVRAIMQVTRHNRRARKLALPNTLTQSQVDHAYAYFNNTCAVCGSQLRDLFGEVNPNLDHWIALSDPRSDNPGTVVTNMLPTCSKCNHSKHDSDPIEWVTRKFGKKRATQILARIQAYFELVKSN